MKSLTPPALSSKLGPFHFVGIGGIGMSGIAEILHNLGYRVQGSDLSKGPNVQRLEKLGIKIHYQQQEDNIANAKVLVVSSAIKKDNPEIIAARAKRIPVVQRAEMLAELMRLKQAIAIGGTHGKTTTTTLVAAMLDANNIDPTVINGGIINAYGTNARLGEGDWLVAEADESDGSFTKLPASISIVTNMDPEHLDYYGSVEALHQAFKTFITNIPFYGLAILCIDDPNVQALLPHLTDRRIMTYGFSPQAEVRALNPRQEGQISHFDLLIKLYGREDALRIKDVTLPIAGDHNILNALAAVSVGLHLGFDEAQIRKGLKSFSGVRRRFTKVATVKGITIIDDYGHHPVEIAAVLKTARQATKGKVIAVAQPHRYSRLKDHFEDFSTCFNDSDHVFITPVYPAGEAPLEGYNSSTLVSSIRQYGHRSAEQTEQIGELLPWLDENAPEGSIIVFLGAGSITQWAYELSDLLKDSTSSHPTA